MAQTLGTLKQLVESFQAVLYGPDPSSEPYARAEIGSRKTGRIFKPRLFLFVPKTARHTRMTTRFDRRVLPIFDRVITLDVMCWGKDFDDVEQMIGALATGMGMVAGSAGWAPVQEQWWEPGESDNGEMARVTLEVTLPCVQVTFPLGEDRLRKKFTATSTELEAKAGAQGDGNLDYGET